MLYRTKVMRENTYKLKKDLVKTHFSLAKFFFSLAGILVLISGIVFVYSNYIRTEPLEFYKEIENCSVFTHSETIRSSRRSMGSYTIYHVYVHTPEGEKDLNMTVSRSYYTKMSAYDRVGNLKLSFFRTKKGSLFPSYSFGASEREAGHQYIECYPPTVLNTVLAITACLGGACLMVGLFAWRTARRRNEELSAEVAQTGVEESNDEELLREFDEAMQRDPFRRTRSPASVRGNAVSEQEEQISWQEREELLNEFDKLTAGGKYNYKSH